MDRLNLFIFQLMMIVLLKVISSVHMLQVLSNATQWQKFQAARQTLKKEQEEATLWKKSFNIQKNPTKPNFIKIHTCWMSTFEF